MYEGIFTISEVVLAFFNALFQSRDILIHKLRDNCARLLRNFGQNFLLPDVLPRINYINILHPANYVPLESIYLGPECKQFLETLPSECANDARQVRIKCLEFYVTGMEEIKKRLPTDSDLYTEMKFLDPSIALEAKGRTELKDLTKLGSPLDLT